MVREKLKKIKKRIAQEQRGVYGEETASGSSPSPESDDDTASMVKDIVGNKPKSGKPFSLAEEVNKDRGKR